MTHRVKDVFSPRAVHLLKSQSSKCSDRPILLPRSLQSFILVYTSSSSSYASFVPNLSIGLQQLPAPPCAPNLRRGSS